jgi:hypothetical protein
MTKNFSNYTAEDFATDPLFIKWVQQPDDREVGNFWNLWLGKHPNKQHEVEAGRQIVSTITQQYPDLELHETRSLWRRIQNTVHDIPEIQPLGQDMKQLASSIYLGRWLFALFVFLAFVSWLFLVQV